MSWTSGYVVELGYTHGYYRELGPELLRFACLSAGLAAPAGDGLRYLELGFGQGLSIAVHAAAVPGAFWGNDFNPAQAAHARALAAASDACAELSDESFAELAARPDLPEFDIIALHGIWSWVSDENRRILVDLIRRKLRIGGLVYLSYNCFPGSAPIVPLRHLLALHLASAGVPGTPIAGRIAASLAFLQQVADCGRGYFRACPPVTERLADVSRRDASYLAHEYLNADWVVVPFSEVAAQLDRAKLSFAASAHLQDHVALNLSPEGHSLLGRMGSPILRETALDCLLSRQFRKDIFTKGARPLSPLEQEEALRAQAVVLTSRPEEVPNEIQAAVGAAMLQDAVRQPLLAALAEDGHAPKTLGDLARRLAPHGIGWRQLVHYVTLLIGADHVQPARAATEETRRRCAALNSHICARARSNGEIEVLASPVTGSGIPVTRLEQLFLLAARRGRTTPAEQAAFAWELLAAQGVRLATNGKSLDSADANCEEAMRQAVDFAANRRPILQAVGIA